MKIAVWHNLPSGGGKRALYYHVRGLVQRGHSVESWCSPLADRSYLPLSEFVTDHVVPLEVKTGRLTKLTARSEMWQRELHGNLRAELHGLMENSERSAGEISA